MDDLSAIRHTMDAYGFAIDSVQWDLFDDVFTTDVVADYGPLGTWTDLASFKQAFDRIHAPFDATRHAMSNMVCEFDGDIAYATTYGHWVLVIGEKSMQAFGWYEDELVRAGRGWLIRKRQVYVNHVEGDPQMIPRGPDGKQVALASMPAAKTGMGVVLARQRRVSAR